MPNINDDFIPLVYQVPRISQLFWQEYISYFNDARTLIQVGKSKLFAFNSFMLEVFHRLYYELEPQQLNPLPPESAWALKLHAEFDSIIGCEHLAEQCQGNQLAAGRATVEYCRLVYEKLPPPSSELANPQQFRDAIRQLKQNFPLPPSQTFKALLNSTQFSHSNSSSPPKTKQLAQVQWLQQLIEESDDDASVLIQILQRDGKRAVEEMQQYAEHLEETQIRQMLRAAITASERKLKESALWLEMMGLSWGNESGQDLRVSPTEKLALCRQIAGNQKLKQIAKLAGRFQAIAQRVSRRSKSPNAVGEITTIELGNDLARLLPSELQKLATPELFPLFAQGYYDRSLLQYKTRGQDKQSRGPLIVCLDSSGSMAGRPDTWAKAVTAVLGQIAQSDKRYFQVLHFGTQVYRCDEFVPEHQDYSRLLESMLSFYNGGGTNWVAPLNQAIRYIKQQPHYQQADIVMITDGKCALSSDFLAQLQQQKQQLEFTVYGILIGGGGEAKLKSFCERVWAIEDLSGSDAAIEELFLL